MKKFLSFFISCFFAVFAFADVATMSYSGSTTNMKANENNAQLVNLDPNIFYVESNKNSASNEVGLNKDGTIRLYAKSLNGTSLTVALTNAVLDSVIVDIKQITDTVMKITDNSLYIQNTGEKQLWINSIVFYYTLKDPSQIDTIHVDTIKTDTIQEFISPYKVLKYAGTITGNMNENENNAELLNLNPDTFSVFVYKNGGGSYPGYNKDGTVRLYYDSSDKVKNGNMIEVSVNDGISLIIDSINVHYNKSTEANGEIDVFNNGFTIQNVESSKKQVRIDDIYIFYSIPNNGPTTNLVDYILDKTQPMYNIWGIRVDSNYKGIIIQNNRKFINK